MDDLKLCKKCKLLNRSAKHIKKHFQDETGIRLYQSIGDCQVTKEPIFERFHKPVDAKCKIGITE